MEIGQVLRASTEGFTCGTRSTDIIHPTFGAFVKTYSLQNRDEMIVIGLITAIRVDDDPLVRQLILAGNMNSATIRDQRENRMIPVEIDVLNIGYAAGSQIRHSLPPRPPLSLDPVEMCDQDEVLAFTEQIGFARLVLNAPGIANNVELLAAALRKAAEVRHTDDRMEFLITAGRQAALLLSNDLQRLQHLLTLIRPN